MAANPTAPVGFIQATWPMPDKTTTYVFDNLLPVAVTITVPAGVSFVRIQPTAGPAFINKNAPAADLTGTGAGSAVDNASVTIAKELPSYFSVLGVASFSLIGAPNDAVSISFYRQHGDGVLA